MEQVLLCRGAAIASDGHYFWQCDAADYVKHYGIGLPEDFIAYGTDRKWIAAPALSRDEVIEVDARLSELIRSQCRDRTGGIPRTSGDAQ